MADSAGRGRWVRFGAWVVVMILPLIAYGIAGLVGKAGREGAGLVVLGSQTLAIGLLLTTPRGAILLHRVASVACMVVVPWAGWVAMGSAWWVGAWWALSAAVVMMSWWWRERAATPWVLTPMLWHPLLVQPGGWSDGLAMASLALAAAATALLATRMSAAGRARHAAMKWMERGVWGAWAASVVMALG